jgi:hypothetical protein
LAIAIGLLTVFSNGEERDGEAVLLGCPGWGAHHRIRTDDLVLTKDVLYRLS